MNNGRSEKDRIQLSLPVNAAYVSAARLTASSVANRMGFDIDEIEDIKAAVSEACTYTIKKLSINNNENFSIMFFLKQDVLEISIETKADLEMETQEEEMSLIMIKALMDEMEVDCQEDGYISIKMVKRHQASLFI